MRAPRMLALLGGLAAAATLEPPCDVLVAGGSLASLAAAVAAANASLALSPAAPAAVCLLEITDWLGGQASFSGVDLDGWPWQRSRPLGTSHPVVRFVAPLRPACRPARRTRSRSRLRRRRPMPMARDL